MKQLKYISVILLSLVSLVACESDLDKLTFHESDVVASQLSALPDTYILEEGNAQLAVDTFKWSKAEYGYQAAVTYRLEIDFKGRDFANAKVLSSAIGKYEAVITTEELNKAVLALDSLYGVLDPTHIPDSVGAHEMEFRISSTLGDAVPMTYSNVVSSIITTYYVIPVSIKDPIYLVGNLIAGLPTWTNSKDQIGNGLQVLFSDNSPNSNSKYTYTAYFDAGGQAKFPTVAGVWDPCWGWNGTALEYVNNSGNYTGPATAGYYTLNIDFGALTIDVVPYTGSTTSYTTIGVLGDATSGGWDSDIDLTQVAPHIWTGRVTLTAGALKFRAENGWDVNWGAQTAEKQDLPFGIGKSGGDNFAIEDAGEYYIAFNDLTGHYIVILASKLP